MATISLDRKDVVIASAYGRGHWLASHLSELGWKVSLFDFTGALGPFTPEDYEGPFGLLETDLVSGSQKSHWSTEFGADTVEQVQNGYTIWLKDGPLEGSSQLSTFHTQERALSLAVRNYLHMVGDLSDIRLKNERSQLAKLPFENSWLVRFMHQFHSNEFRDHVSSLENDFATPFFSRYFVRSLDQGSHKKSLQQLRALNVEVVEDPEIISAKINGDEQVVLSAKHGEIETRSLVWCLTSFETDKVAKEFSKSYYGNVKPKSDWQWRKFIVSFKEQPQEVPQSFVLLGDPHLPWTHSNAVNVRTTNEYWICWMRLPSHQTGSGYFDEQASELLSVVNQRLPWAEATARYSGDSAPAWQVYDYSQIKNLREKISKNVFVSGPEHWKGVDPLSKFLAYRGVLSKLEEIRRVWDARQAKRELKEAQRLQKQKAKQQAKDDRKRAE